MAELERAVYVQRLDPEKREEYVEAHENVPEAVTDAMERGDVERFDLYLFEDVAICIVDAPDVDAYFEETEGDPELEEWERYTGRFKRSGVDVDAEEGDQIPFAERIWSFEGDGDAGGGAGSD